MTPYEKALIELVHYDPATGLLWWKKRRKGIVFTRPIGSKDTNGYIKTQVVNVQDYAHRIAWFLHYNDWPADEIDHKNRKRDDNRIANLRTVTTAQNQMNRPAPINNTTGIKGVSITAYGRYKVTKCGKYCGTFKTKQEAAEAYARN